MSLALKKLVFCLVSLVLFISIFLLVDKALAAGNYGNYGLDATVNSNNVSYSAFSVAAIGNSPGGFLSSKVGQIVGAVLSFVGVLMLVLVVYAGILWMTAGGNQEQTKKAMGIIFAAVLGLFIILAAYALVSFIGQQVVSAP